MHYQFYCRDLHNCSHVRTEAWLKSQAETVEVAIPGMATIVFYKFELDGRTCALLPQATAAVLPVAIMSSALAWAAEVCYIECDGKDWTRIKDFDGNYSLADVEMGVKDDPKLCAAGGGSCRITRKRAEIGRASCRERV